MKRKRLSHDEWKEVLDKNQTIRYVDNAHFKGYIAEIDIFEVSAPQIWKFNDEDIVVSQKGYKWLAILPSDEYYCITAMLNEENKILLWYIDMIAGQGIDEDGIPYFDDLYLDLVVSPDGTVIEDDRDELEEALERKDITLGQFELANRTCSKLKEGILSNITSFTEFTMKCRGFLNITAKKLVVIFPGVGYGIDSPLLYYADFIYETNGYERLHMNYQDILLDAELSLEEKRKRLRAYVLSRIESIDFEEYRDIVFVSKSIGTVEAGWIAEKLGIEVTQIFLTPLEEAIPYCNRNCRIAIGTKDKAYPVYKKYCEEKGIHTLYIDNANHSLEVEGKPYESIEVLKMVMEFIEVNSEF